MAVNSEIASEQRQWNGIEEKRCNTAVPELHVCRRSGAEEGRRSLAGQFCGLTTRLHGLVLPLVG
ncbi:hypothetical protein TIFTF001_036558 [Ficus carica]|uniref:Uncharacterized protein n=1 Tax=Ficus carica TaxID=3494 RepID=A0AA88JCV2_FICCA|nr:hypothetical protein TIFTF001_036552 [Ficus carica]GMN67496.1 hypothetical protein TIFTF001_036558 [Ficus carica]